MVYGRKLARISGFITRSCDRDTYSDTKKNVIGKYLRRAPYLRRSMLSKNHQVRVRQTKFSFKCAIRIRGCGGVDFTSNEKQISLGSYVGTSCMAALPSLIRYQMIGIWEPGLDIFEITKEQESPRIFQTRTRMMLSQMASLDQEIKPRTRFKYVVQRSMPMDFTDPRLKKVPLAHFRWLFVASVPIRLHSNLG